MVIFSCTCSHTSCYAMVILGWGWVGWGGTITFMSTCTHTSCYVIVMFSCTCTHTSYYVMVIFSCTCSHTSCYAMDILGWGWVGWGGAMTFMSTCTHTSCYVIVMFSCTCTHTRHATLWWSSLALAHTRHATLWLSWDHWHLTDFSKNFARPSKQWSASEKKEQKCCIPKKNTNLCQKTK